MGKNRVGGVLGKSGFARLNEHLDSDSDKNSDCPNGKILGIGV